MIGTILKYAGAAALLGILVYVVWEPVLPSKWIVKEMAEAIDPYRVTLPQPVVVRFELGGKGGGTYTIVVDKGAAEVVEGSTDTVDLILYMDARDFNDLMFAFSKGNADEYTFRSLIVSKVITFAGDMNVFKELFSKEGVTQ